MAFALLSRFRSKTQSSVKPVPKQKSARAQHSADSRFGFAKPVFQPHAAALPTAPVIQTKLKVGEPDDKFEEEADRVAELTGNDNGSIPPSAAAQSRNAVGSLQRLYSNQAVLQMRNGSGGSPAPSVPLRPSQSRILQRKCACGGAAGMLGACEECSKKQRWGLQTKLKINEPGDIYEQEADRIADQVMATPAHHAVSGAPPRIQRFAGQPNGQMDAAPASVDHALASPGRSLEPALRRDMERRFGHDFSRVRVHTDARAAESARAVNALAYAVGRDVVFGAGRYAPGTTEGDRLLAHELTHVVQQSEAAPVAGGGSAGSGVTVAQSSPTPEIMRSSLFNSTMKICHRVLESRGFAITEGGLKVTTFARWQPSDEWQGTRAELQCGNPEFSITLVRDDPVFDNDFGTCTFPMGVPFSRQWTDLSEDDDWYLTIWTNNTNPNCCLEGYIEVAQERGLSGDSCTKPPPGPLEILHSALDVAGMLPFLGAFPDAINAGIYAIEGEWGKAGLSALAAIPVFGDAPKGASLIYKRGKEAVQVSGDAVQRAGKAKIAKGLDEARAASKLKSAAAIEAKTTQKELGAVGEATSAERAVKTAAEEKAAREAAEKAGKEKAGKETAEKVEKEAAESAVKREKCYPIYLEQTAYCGQTYTDDYLYNLCMTNAWKNYIRCLNGLPPNPLVPG
jgi:hypothetical protein